MAHVYDRPLKADVNTAWAVRHGLTAGAIAGIVFAIAEMAAAWLSQGNPLLPLHMIAGLPLQRDPMQIDPMTALSIGFLAHMFYSMIFGLIVALIVSSLDVFSRSSTATTILVTVLALLSWPVNFYLIAPRLNAPWFASSTDPLTQALLHIVFGLVLGIYLGSKLPRSSHASSAIRN